QLFIAYRHIPWNFMGRSNRAVRLDTFAQMDSALIAILALTSLYVDRDFFTDYVGIWNWLGSDIQHRTRFILGCVLFFLSSCIVDMVFRCMGECVSTGWIAAGIQMGFD
ncbi:MAG: hypothetical protein AAGA30_20655, partial [Planctomycetota bacterium]